MDKLSQKNIVAMMKRIAYVTFGMIIGSSLFVNCSLQRPGAKGSSTLPSSFDHTGITLACTTCHEAARPAPPHDQLHECNICHLNTQPWQITTNPHTTGQDVKDRCLGCHGAGMMAAVTIPKPAGVANFQFSPLTVSGGIFDHTDPTFGGTGECSNCHSSSVPTSPVMSDWANGNYPHPTSTIPTPCLGCHTTNQAGMGLGAIASTGNTPYDHTLNPQGPTQDCSSCHNSPNNVGRTWQVTAFSHAGIGATTCTTCHGGDDGYLNLAVPWNQMSHQVAGMPNDCAVCHQAYASTHNFTVGPPTAWQAETKVNDDTTPLGALGIFHKNIGSIPVTCQNCHKNPPSGTVGKVSLVGSVPTGGFFDHSGNGGTGDCVTCHTGTIANVGLTWVGGVFSHVPAPNNCLSCHSYAQVPTGTVSSNGVSHDHATDKAQNAECYTCHNQPANIGRSWQTVGVDHTLASITSQTCTTCHSKDTSPLPGYINIAAKPTNQMLHTFAGIPDCKSCHTPPGAGVFTGSWLAENPVIAKGAIADIPLGKFHKAIASPATCNACHTGEMPANGTIFITSSNISFDHANVNLASADCVSCHSGSIGTSWKNANYTHNPVPAQCTSCHLKDSQYVNFQAAPKNQMNHAYAGGIPECAVCHSAKSQASGWTNWIMNAAIPAVASPNMVVPNGAFTIASKGNVHTNMTVSVTGLDNCSTCHQAPAGNLSDGKNAQNHASFTTKCEGCHNLAANVGLTWTGAVGNPHPTLARSSACLGCHGVGGNAPKIPTGPQSNPNPPTIIAGKPTGGYFDHSRTQYMINGGECNQCHSPPTTAAGIQDMTLWKTSAATYYQHQLIPLSTCTTCHIAAQRPVGQVGSGANIYTHSANDTECVGCHLPSRAGIDWTGAMPAGHSPPFTKGCIGCHGVGGSHDDSITPVKNVWKIVGPATYNANGTASSGAYNHDPTLGGSQDCVVCHTQTTKALASVGVTWVGTGWYSHTGMIATTSCLPCHGKGHLGSDSATATNYMQCTFCHEHTFKAQPVPTGTPPYFNGDMSSGKSQMGC